MSDEQPLDLEPWLNGDAQWVERQVIGAAMTGSPAIDQVRQAIEPEDFTFHPHIGLMRMIYAIHSGGGCPDPAEVFDRIRGTQIAKDLGGQAAYWLQDTRDLAGIGMNGQYFAERLRDLSRRRELSRIIEYSRDIINRPQGTASEVAEYIEESIFKYNDASIDAAKTVVPLVQAKERLIDRLSESDPRPELHYRTGFEALDNYIGGLRPGRLYILAARPGVGKSAMALGLALNMANNDVSSLIFSLEMDQDEIMQRAMAIRSGVPLSAIMDGRLTGDQCESIASARGVNGIYIDDAATLKASQIASATRMAIRRHEVKVVFLDYLQLLSPENLKDPRHLQVGSDTRRLKELARSCKVPVVCLCQLNRETSDTVEPGLTQLRDSGEIEQNADVVILLWRSINGDDGPMQTIQAKVAKQRNGPTGTFELTYRRPCVRFENKHVANW